MTTPLIPSSFDEATENVVLNTRRSEDFMAGVAYLLDKLTPGVVDRDTARAEAEREASRLFPIVVNYEDLSDTTRIWRQFAPNGERQWFWTSAGRNEVMTSPNPPRGARTNDDLRKLARLLMEDDA